MQNSCRVFGSCAGIKKPSDSVDMHKKRSDLIATPKYKHSLEKYALGTLKDKGNANVNGPIQARQIASNTQESYNDQSKKFKKADRYGVRSK